jgi:hypothetical protein
VLTRGYLDTSEGYLDTVQVLTRGYLDTVEGAVSSVYA